MSSEISLRRVASWGKNVINSLEPARRNARCCRGALRFPTEPSFKFPGDKNKGVGMEPGLRASAPERGRRRMLRMQERLCSIPVPPQVKPPFSQPKHWPGRSHHEGFRETLGLQGVGLFPLQTRLRSAPGSSGSRAAELRVYFFSLPF